MSERRRRIDRLSRLIDLHQLSVDECERRVRSAELALARAERVLEAEKANHDRLQAFFAHPDRHTGLDLRQTEVALHASVARQVWLAQNVEKAVASVESERRAWMEARRDRKVVEKLRERRLLDAERVMQNLMQQANDEVAITRHRRMKSED